MPCIPAGRKNGYAANLFGALILGLFSPLFSIAAEETPIVKDTDVVAMRSSTKEELLMFWEEKELYVQTATRIEKPISQVAENMTIITAKEIEDMNAHTVAEVLSRVPGMFVDFQGQDFARWSLLHSQGSSERLVTVLLDGIALNFLSGGNAETSTIPVRIIDRIEIIKGPASSAWGSGLGGVVNIITKGTGNSSNPKGTVSASYGQANSQDYNAEVSGKEGQVGYYLFGGRQQSDGLRNDRNMDQDRGYAKVHIAATKDLGIQLTTGYSNPSEYSGDVTGNGATFNSRSQLTSFFATSSLDYRISQNLNLNASGHVLQQKVDLPVKFATPFQTALPGELFKESIFDEQLEGGDIKLKYAGSMHTAVLGMDYNHGELIQTTNVGPLYQSFGVPATSVTKPSSDTWGIFANDTVNLGKLAVTPGARLDHDTIGGSFASPSLGTTYELAEHTVARASVARGFTSPPLGYTSGGGTFLVANPDLKREEGWSYQVGMESGLTDYLHVKGTLFRHDTENTISDRLNAAKQVTNIGNVIRQGCELQVETVPVYNLSLQASYSYAHMDAENPPTGYGREWDDYAYLAGLKYDDHDSWVAQLTGTYVWMEQPASANAKFDLIWDFNINKKVYATETTSMDLFMTVHNLFSGASYTYYGYPNANEWVEAGLRFKF